MFCKNCGNENPDSANFCKGCGGSIGGSNQNVSGNNFSVSQGNVQKTAWDFYQSVFKKYATFEGRAQRAEYWYFSLFNMLVYFGFLLLSSVFPREIQTFVSMLIMIYVFGVVIPGLAVSVRRLHDIGKSGWMVLINAIPIIGPIWMLVLTVTDSDPGFNQYGPNPKGVNNNFQN